MQFRLWALRVVRHKRFFLHATLVLATLFFMHAAEAARICWTNPTEYVLEPGAEIAELIGAGELQTITLYRDDEVFRTYPAGEPGETKCVTIRQPEGTYDWKATVSDIDGEVSAFSNTVTKTEERLDSPTDGEVLRSPTDGEVIRE